MRKNPLARLGHPRRAAHIPGAEARLLEDEGHLMLLAHRVGEVHAWLSERL